MLHVAAVAQATARKELTLSDVVASVRIAAPIGSEAGVIRQVVLPPAGRSPARTVLVRAESRRYGDEKRLRGR
jgi:hypothetical protein